MVLWLQKPLIRPSHILDAMPELYFAFGGHPFTHFLPAEMLERVRNTCDLICFDLAWSFYLIDHATDMLTEVAETINSRRGLFHPKGWSNILPALIAWCLQITIAHNDVNIQSGSIQLARKSDPFLSTLSVALKEGV